MNKEANDLILTHIKEQSIDILGYVPNDNDLNGVLLNVLDDIQYRITEYTDHCVRTYGLHDREVNNEKQ